MASRIGAGSEHTLKQGPKLRGLALAALGVVVVAAVTAGIVRRQTSDEAVTPAPAVVTAPTAVDAPPATAARELPVIYIVGTQEEADMHQQALAEADNIRYTMGLPPLEHSVFVAATPEMGDSYIRATEDANQIRYSEGLPPYRVVDLRR